MKGLSETEEKVFSFIEEHHMLKTHDRVVAGISGGADSLCLLFLLLEWAKRVPLSLAVVHVNHKIRAEAMEDALYVKRICEKWDIPFYLMEEDVRVRARREKCSEEEAGRTARYEAFAKAASTFGAAKIAVAHNLNDRSETMLFHLFRGAGLKGLCGILPVRDNIIRPLLCLERREIEAYLVQRKISWREDITNAGDAYTRNRIRHHILSYAEKEIAPGCASNMARTAQTLSETEQYLEEQTALSLKRCIARACGKDRVEIDISIFLQEHTAIRKRILLSLIKSMSPSEKDISCLHVHSLLTLFEKEGNRVICLPYGIRGRREYDRVILEFASVAAAERNDEYVINLKELGGETLSIDIREGQTLEFSIFSRGNLEDFPEKECTKWFDCDKIRKSLIVRTRRTGDYLTIADGRGGQMHKSIKDFMVTAKIPRERRDEIPLLAEEQHVLWLMGWRISEYYKISRNTKHILQVQLRGNAESGKMEENNGGKS